jgi:hypothetical protein
MRTSDGAESPRSPGGQPPSDAPFDAIRRAVVDLVHASRSVLDAVEGAVQDDAQWAHIRTWFDRSGATVPVAADDDADHRESGMTNKRTVDPLAATLTTIEVE